MRLPLPPPVDIAIAGAFLLLTVTEALFRADVSSPVLHVVVAGIAMIVLAWRRSFPIGVAVWLVATNVLINPQGEFSTLLSLVLVCYTIGSMTEAPRSYAGLAVVVLTFMGVSIAEGLVPSDVAAGLVFFVGPWSVGAAVRQRTARAEEAVARADRLEAQREAEAAAAAAEERTRIARELHDIVSHSISVVTIQTQAVRRRLGPEHAKEAADLAAVEATAREALAEMRRLFGVLRADGETASLTPQPGLHELDRLVAQVRGSGLDVQVDVAGERYDLPPGVDLAAYRIVQEGLTNALRLPVAAGRRAGPRGRGRGGERRGGGRGGSSAPARRHVDGHPDARPRWDRRHPPAARAGCADPSARADHLRPRRVRLRGVACRCLRPPAQGRSPVSGTGSRR